MTMTDTGRLAEGVYPTGEGTLDGGTTASSCATIRERGASAQAGGLRDIPETDDPRIPYKWKMIEYALISAIGSVTCAFRRYVPVEQAELFDELFGLEGDSRLSRSRHPTSSFDARDHPLVRVVLPAYCYAYQLDGHQAFHEEIEGEGITPSTMAGFLLTPFSFLRCVCFPDDPLMEMLETAEARDKIFVEKDRWKCVTGRELSLLSGKTEEDILTEIDKRYMSSHTYWNAWGNPTNFVHDSDAAIFWLMKQPGFIPMRTSADDRTATEASSKR